MNTTTTAAPYYLLQLLGWSVFSLIHVLFTAIYLPFSMSTVVNGLFIGTAGLLTTHLLRTVYRTSFFDLKRPAQLVTHGLTCTLLATLLWEGLIIAVLHIAVLRYYTWDTMSWAAAGFWYYYYFSVLTLWSLVYFAVKIVRQRRQETIEKLQLEIALRDAELHNLKWQLNPHFLFNALNSVRALISEDSERAKDMVTRVAQLLRYALATPEQKTVPLGQELECVKTYLALEQVRFEERLVYSIHVEDGCLELPMLPMCLQTLVENAIKHGTARLAAGGRIDLAIVRTPRGMRITIENSGVLAAPLVFGTGLKNTRARIAMVFGERSTLTLTQKTEDIVVTTVELEIPA